jgi:hypothetical protein
MSLKKKIGAAVVGTAGLAAVAYVIARVGNPSSQRLTALITG